VFSTLKYLPPIEVIKRRTNLSEKPSLREIFGTSSPFLWYCFLKEFEIIQEFREISKSLEKNVMWWEIHHWLVYEPGAIQFSVYELGSLFGR